MAVAVDPAGRPVWIEAPPFASGVSGDPPDRVRLTRTGSGVVLENTHLRVAIAADGSMTSLVHRASGRDALAGRGNLLEIYDDQPVGQSYQCVLADGHGERILVAKVKEQLKARGK